MDENQSNHMICINLVKFKFILLCIRQEKLFGPRAHGLKKNSTQVKSVVFNKNKEKSNEN